MSVIDDSRAQALEVARSPSGPGRVLHQFPVSHFCEKARWSLDVKGLDYAVRNLFPGMHGRINRRLVGRSSVPVLIDGDRVIHDSSAIALYLEATYPERRLLPEDNGLRALALAIESYFDETIGPAVRHWIYGQLLRRGGTATRIFFRGYGKASRFTGKLLRPLFERQLARRYPGDEASLAAMEGTLLEGLERLENITERDPGRYLVGDTLTLADLTAAALLAPVVGPPSSPWFDDAGVPSPILALRERVRERPGGQWVMRRYERDRHLPAPVVRPLRLLANEPQPS